MMARRHEEDDSMPRRATGAEEPAGEGLAVLTHHDRVRVSDSALATIIGLAAHEVPGVVGMAPASLGEGLRRVLGLAQVDEGVEVVRSDGEDTVRVDLHVVVAYGVNIPAVADSVRERVQYAASAFAGVKTGDITVHVAGVSRG
jgi:uncharacterized alkaline shock family protein YloU